MKSGIEVAKEYDIKIITDIKSYNFIINKINKVTYLFAKNNLLIPIDETNDKIIVAVADPLDLDPIEEMRFLLKKEIEVVVCEKEQLEEAIEICYHQKEEEKQKLFHSNKNQEKSNDSEGYDLLERSSDNQVIKILNSILLEAIQQGSSDIHFEPHENRLNIRYRIDGILQERPSPPKEYNQQILTRIKVMAKLDIAEKRLPQDGRIKLKIGKREIDFRVSTIPVVYGERIVLRILDKGNIILGLDKIGMTEKTIKDFRKMISLSEGIILVSGPTGSGKTTTLYSAISEINSTETNIMTIEDPVEYKLQNIAQIAVNPKIELTFAKGLRHILRQDPDIIMIGEIRDRETAQIAIQSSLTGHLVFSTLHTNDSLSALTRLADMGIEPYLLSSSIVGILAQRLVRKICPDCKVSYVPERKELEELKIEADVLYKGEGCENCFNTGYKGRHGIYELILVNKAIKKQINKNIDLEEIKKIVGKDFSTLKENGIELVRQGITTTKELFRVTRAVE